MKNDRIYLKHILDAISKVDQYVGVGYDEFMAHSQKEKADLSRRS